jgi:glycosyltransferase involved in cell wall biosynthesis
MADTQRAAGVRDRQCKVVITVNARAADRDLHGGTDNAIGRRTDFAELAAALGADIVDWDVADQTWVWRMLRRRLGFGPVAAGLVFLRSRRYDAVWCFTEVEGLLLALLFKLFRIRRVLFVIGIETLSPKTLFLIKRLRVWTHFTAILPTSSYQAAELRRIVALPAEKVIVLPYQVDCDYFAPCAERPPQSGTPYVVAVGLESRDYATLTAAMDGVDAHLKIAAASLWSGRKGQSIEPRPPQLTVGSYNYAELRDLYDGAALAVVPLRESPYQHGITALQEAMAMSLPVIVTRTTGQSDVVVDRRSVLRTNPALATRGGFGAMFAAHRPDLQESNGFYVGTGDVETLRNTINYLLAERDVAVGLGRRARRFAQDALSIELFVERCVRLISAACDGKRVSSEILAGTCATGGNAEAHQNGPLAIAEESQQ